MIENNAALVDHADILAGIPGAIVREPDGMLERGVVQKERRSLSPNDVKEWISSPDIGAGQGLVHQYSPNK